MSTLFNRLFGTGPTTKTPKMSSSDAIAQNRNTVSMLERKIKFTTDKHVTPLRQQALTLAKKGTAKAKAEARRLLGKTKIYEKQVTQMEAQLMNLESVRIALEGSAITQEVFNSMNNGARVLNDGLPNGDTLDDILADTEEALEQAADVSEALSSKISIGVPLDDDDLDAELQEMLGEEDPDELDALLQEVPVAFPKVPATTVPVAKEPSEDPVLAELLAFAN
jgi:hypothetical protein